MSNFFILEDGPIASPGNCGICGYSGIDRVYLDPRKDFEFYGTFIICELCVGAMANDFGFMQPAQVSYLKSQLEVAYEELVTLRAAVANLESVHDLITQFNAGSDARSSIDLDVLRIAGEQGSSTESSGATNPGGPVKSAGNQKVDDDVSLTRPDDLPNSKRGSRGSLTI